MVRCNECITPIENPTVKFNSFGVCDLCSSIKEKKYLGPNALKKKIISFQKNKKSKYDCAIGFSGGRDSTYLLYYLKKILNLEVAAITIDNQFLPDGTLNNIKNIASLLKVDLFIKKHSYLKKSFKHHLSCFFKRPDPAMITALCVGCRYGISRGIYDFMIYHKIPVYINGSTPFEGGSYKTALLRIPRYSRSKKSLVRGYLKQVILNPYWVVNFPSLYRQAKEFSAFYGKIFRKRLEKKGYVYISPFYDYIRWKETEIIKVLGKLGWEKNSNTGSTWRGDCDVALLKIYMYKKLLGFNDKDDSLSALIRDGQLSRELAMNRLKSEQFISNKVISSILRKYGFSFLKIDNLLRNTKYF